MSIKNELKKTAKKLAPIVAAATVALTPTAAQANEKADAVKEDVRTEAEIGRDAFFNKLTQRERSSIIHEIKKGTILELKEFLDVKGLAKEASRYVDKYDAYKKLGSNNLQVAFDDHFIKIRIDSYAEKGLSSDQKAMRINRKTGEVEMVPALTENGEADVSSMNGFLVSINKDGDYNVAFENHHVKGGKLSTTDHVDNSLKNKSEVVDNIGKKVLNTVIGR